MPIQATSKIWHNGNLIPWEQANIHVMSHVIHYGSSVFEGIRCYGQPQGSAIFRLPEHMQRLLDSAKIYRIAVPFTLDELCSAVVDVIEANGVAPCYIRPSCCWATAKSASTPRARPSRSTSPTSRGANTSPARALTCASPVGNRLAPNTLPAMAKAGANYMNSQLIRMEAETNGYAEGIALDVNGQVSEGSGENVFVVRNGVIYTPTLGNSALSGITRDSVLTIARHLGFTVSEQAIPREMLYIADEVFFTGTAAEVTPIRSIDRIVIGDGKPARSPGRSPTNTLASPTVSSPTASAGSLRSR